MRDFAEAKCILVVDDNEEIRDLLRAALEDSGYRVFEAPNGKLAEEHVSVRRTDLMITDLVMPEQEGIETIRRVKALAPRTKIIAMSGYLSVYLRTARLLGADETIPKPFSCSEMVEAGGRLLETEP